MMVMSSLPRLGATSKSELDWFARGGPVSRDAFVVFGASNKGRERAFYSLNRKGYNVPASKRAKRLVVTHVHVDRASCQPF